MLSNLVFPSAFGRGRRIHSLLANPESLEKNGHPKARVSLPNTKPAEITRTRFSTIETLYRDDSSSMSILALLLLPAWIKTARHNAGSEAKANAVVRAANPGLWQQLFSDEMQLTSWKCGQGRDLWIRNRSTKELGMGGRTSG